MGDPRRHSRRPGLWPLEAVKQPSTDGLGGGSSTSRGSSRTAPFNIAVEAPLDGPISEGVCDRTLFSLGRSPSRMVATVGTTPTPPLCCHQPQHMCDPPLPASEVAKIGNSATPLSQALTQGATGGPGVS
jgi:hypothetical protein